MVVEIHRRSVFTLAEACEVLPIVFRITKTYSEKVASQIERLNSLTEEQKADQTAPLEEQINQMVQEWQGKVSKLGAHPKGLWIADFDAGDGYFCWKFPERTIEYWHSYDDGFTKRLHVRERAQKAAILNYPI